MNTNTQSEWVDTASGTIETEYRTALLKYIVLFWDKLYSEIPRERRSMPLCKGRLRGAVV